MKERVTRLGAPQIPPAASLSSDAEFGGEERQDPFWIKLKIPSKIVKNW